MTVQNYSRSIEVSVSPGAAFEAVTIGFPHWWSETEGVAKTVGDRLTFRFDPTYWTFEVSEISRPETVEYKCVEANHCDTDAEGEIKDEWLGTHMRWTIEASGTGSRITLEHVGLTPSLNCWEICEAGWDHFFVGSLKAYLDTGKGFPGAG